MTGQPGKIAFRTMLDHTDIRLMLGSSIGVLALHAGLEGGTAELAYTLGNRTGASVLAFHQHRGVGRLHVSSARYDQDLCPELRTFLNHVTVVFSLHGHQEPGAEGDIFLGGANRELADAVAADLTHAGTPFQPVTDLAAIPTRLAGLNPRNPVNLGRYPGVQLELPAAARGIRRDGPRGTRAVPDAALVAGLTNTIGALRSSAA